MRPCVCDVNMSHCFLLKVHSRYGAMSTCSPCTQQQSKVCIQTFNIKASNCPNAFTVHQKHTRGSTNTMRVTAANLIDGIRVDQPTQKGSVHDVISMVTRKDNSHATQTFSRITSNHPELHPKCVKLRINGKGRETPVADATTLVEIAWLCPGKTAVQFRRKGAESVCRMLGGDLTLVDEIQRRHAQVAGTAEE